MNGTVIKHNVLLTASPEQTAVSKVRLHGIGRKARLADTDSDHNVYYCMADPDHSRRLLEEMQSFGTDLNSRVVDPGFVDAPGGDYTLRADSPLPGTGFRPLPLDKMFIGKLGTAGAVKVE